MKYELRDMVDRALRVIQTGWQMKKVEWTYEILERWLSSGTYEILIAGWVEGRSKVLMVKRQIQWNDWPGMFPKEGYTADDQLEKSRIEEEAWYQVMTQLLNIALHNCWTSTIQLCRDHWKLEGDSKVRQYPLTPEECVEFPVMRVGKEGHVLPTIKECQDVIDQLSGVPKALMVPQQVPKVYQPDGSLDRPVA